MSDQTVTAMDGLHRLLDDVLPPGWQALAEHYVRVLDGDNPTRLGTVPVDLAGAIGAHWSLGHRRRHGEVRTAVVSPDASTDGWSSPHSLVFLVCDDASFLVDSLRMALERAGHSLHLLVHPMLSVQRADDGTIRTVGDRRSPIEAWVMIEIDRIRPDEASSIEDVVRRAVAEVHLAVSDFEAMRVEMSDVASDLEHLPPEGVDAPLVESVVRLLRWLTRRNFVFLGAATYDLLKDGSLVPLEGSGLGLLRRPHEPDPPAATHGRLLDIARLDVVSSVHRPARPMCLSIRRFDAAGHVRGEHRFVGLLAASAYRASVLDVPYVKERAGAVLVQAGFPTESHDGRALRTILETFPRDEIFALDGAQLTDIAQSILALADRQIVRVMPLPSTAGEWSTFLVYIPRSRFDVRLVERVGDVMAEMTNAVDVETDAFVGTGALARITVTLRRVTTFDLARLERTIDDVTRPWLEDVRLELAQRCGEADGLDIADRILPGVPVSYQASTVAGEAVDDLLIADGLPIGGLATRIVVGGAESSSWRVKLFREGDALALSDLVPVLENLGMRVRDERAHVITLRDPTAAHVVTAADRVVAPHVGVVHIHDVRVDMHGDVVAFEGRVDEVRRTLEMVLAESVESDGFNRLVLLAGLTAAETSILRAYAKYLRQIGFAFSQQYIEGALARHPELARALIDLFAARLGPSIAERQEAETQCRQIVLTALDRIPSLDDDRIGRTLLQLIRATVRTNAHCEGRGALALKFDPAAVPDLPAPRPWAEIWVCSPLVEGVHLRGGPIARGGIRWSDRREDFRTEVLGLMKAQMVKNAVIVPVGAKGGFVVKRTPVSGGSVAEMSRDEVVARYRDFISALLDVTDDIRDGEVVPPRDVVRHDGDDPYLVVAADKGTSNLSDVANEVATTRGFWLGDAFASGGSAGYDHKEMGITARGAWESVRRHAHTLGLDADRDAMTIVGIGDMSGDVFGNGLLRSKHLRLVAAFDHRHIFLDPDPDPEVAFTERQRLFALERSTWADYNPSALSPGGMVVARSTKQIEISDQVRARLGVQTAMMTPDELVQSILRAPVDVLWNGGIGTYVKSSTESHLDVGDRSNDSVRIDGGQLRCRIVAEGGNLGFTQRGRVEYARSGGLINTDAIDNSAGVDCSDHEVNIKILLADATTTGRLDRDERDRLLASMTDAVAELVLDDNRAQTLALAIARRQALDMVDVHRRYLDALESEGWLDRGLESLPTDRELADRQAAGEGLSAPEFAVLLAYTKNADITEVVRSDLPDSAYLLPELHRYFPAPLRELFPDLIESHRLRREIIATSVVNQMVNTSGITFDQRLTEETGASTPDVVRAWIAARDILGAPWLWDRVEGVATQVKPEVHLEMLVELRRMVERCTLWVLRHRRPPVDLIDTVERLGPMVRRVRDTLPDAVVGPLAARARSLEASRLVAGVPDDLATASAMWPFVHTAFDVVDVALALESDPVEVHAAYWALFDRLGAIWLWEGIGALPRTSRWSSQARNALRDDLLATLADLTLDVVRSSPGCGASDALDRWLDRNRQSVTRAQVVHGDIVRAGTRDVTTLAVSLRQLRNLLLTSRDSPD